MLNIQDVSHLSKKEQKAYNRFVESVENGNLPVLPCIEMNLKEMKEETLNQSKIGGTPFLKSFKEIPVDENNVPMILLAQINLSQLPEQQEIFPVKEGILQFWISSEDPMYGMSENLKENNINSRLVYIKEPITDLSFEEIQSHMKSIDSNNDDIPFSGAFSIEFKLTKQTITCADYKYDEDVLALWNKVNPSFKLKSMFGDYDELMEPVCNTFTAKEPYNQIGGFPYFDQRDPRTNDQELKMYDRVLLQIDSTRDGSSSIMWGDLGIANILVKSADLEAMKFADYMYSWDCG
ncbi:YwqG family protein [Staphylococcus aureus]|nr:YwqG family protein [Staphylococcus aureus]